MNLMPPGGAKHLLQCNQQLKVKKGEFANNGTFEQKTVHRMYMFKFAQCQLHALFVVSYLFVSFLFPVLVRLSPQRPHINTWRCVYFMSYMGVYVSACAYLGQYFLSIFTAGLCSRVVKWCAGGVAWVLSGLHKKWQSLGQAFPLQFNRCPLRLPNLSHRRAVSSNMWILIKWSPKNF